MLTSPCQSDKDNVEILDVEYLSEEVVAERTHRLELEVYLRTLQAMYAAGPLTQKKEEVLTNLRLLLNISIDEHLKGIKNLVSSGQSF